MLIFALMVVRLGWRLGHPAPALPALAAWQRMGAPRFSHCVLCTARRPAAGGLPGFGVERLPGQILRQGATGMGHQGRGTQGTDEPDALGDGMALIAVIIVHIGAAVRHAAARDGIVQRMTLRAEGGGRDRMSRPLRDGRVPMAAAGPSAATVVENWPSRAMSARGLATVVGKGRVGARREQDHDYVVRP